MDQGIAQADDLAPGDAGIIQAVSLQLLEHTSRLAGYVPPSRLESLLRDTDATFNQQLQIAFDGVVFDRGHVSMRGVTATEFFSSSSSSSAS